MEEEKDIDIKISGYFLTKETEDIEHKLAHLILENFIFCNNGWWYEKEGINWPKDHITLHVICNDIFAWACADSVDITHNEVHELYEMYKKDPVLGVAAWCIKKRKQMPQAPVEQQFRKQGIWDLEELIK